MSVAREQGHIKEIKKPMLTSKNVLIITIIGTIILVLLYKVQLYTNHCLFWLIKCNKETPASFQECANNNRYNCTLSEHMALTMLPYFIPFGCISAGLGTASPQIMLHYIEEGGEKKSIPGSGLLSVASLHILPVPACISTSLK